MIIAFIILSVIGTLTFVSNLISICSVLHMILPPYETFADFPTFQRYYKLFVLIIGHIALNKREEVVNLYSSVKGK